ncbi:MAG: sulfite exporter TauE/SafE family protein, partial [Euryarchaeota archaeon]|nr:sulfite exporter TauE/SafE family protein [Euryarchaeota archaeon]
MTVPAVVGGTPIYADLAVFFLIGLLGGVHCIGMCGPLVTTYAEGMTSTEGALTFHEVRQHGLFNLGRGCFVDVYGSLYLGPAGSSGLPDPEGPSDTAQDGEIRKDCAGVGPYQPKSLAHPLRYFITDLVLVGQNLGHSWVGRIIRSQAHDTMAVTRRDYRSFPGLAGAEVTAKPGVYRGKVAPSGVIAVAAEVLGRHLPVGRHNPLMHASHNLNPAFPPVE